MYFMYQTPQVLAFKINKCYGTLFLNNLIPLQDAKNLNEDSF